MSATKRTTVARAALNQTDAAAYVGVSVRHFRDHCPVRAVELPGRGSRVVLRWRIADLDAWLASLAPKATRRSA
jgi:hypothetical protein